MPTRRRARHAPPHGNRSGEWVEALKESTGVDASRDCESQRLLQSEKQQNRPCCAHRRSMPGRRQPSRCRFACRAASRNGSPQGDAFAPRQATPTRKCSRGPCACETPELNGRRGCACASGSRASWHACGCSAGKSACSRGCSMTLRGMGKSARLRYAFPRGLVKSGMSRWPLAPNGIGSTFSARAASSDTPSSYYELVKSCQPPV